MKKLFILLGIASFIVAKAADNKAFKAEQELLVVKGTYQDWDHRIKIIDQAVSVIDSSNIQADIRIPLRNNLNKINIDFIEQLHLQLKQK